ncbi:MAG TPA: hypothetical protein VLS45_10120, partial [Methylomicrobium sp.]|nr:hypothetical protein [Methylomicrobium sp.]
IPASIYPMIGIGMLIIAKINAVSPKGSILFLRWLFDGQNFFPAHFTKARRLFPAFSPVGSIFQP